VKLYRIDNVYGRPARISYRVAVRHEARRHDTDVMSDTINIRRYRLAYGGADQMELRRWKLRKLPAQRGTATATCGRPAGPRRQGSSDMYASAART
jgi:hypothetical protein